MTHPSSSKSTVAVALRVCGTRRFRHALKQSTKAANKLRRALRRLRKEKERAQ